MDSRRRIPYFVPAYCLLLALSQFVYTVLAAGSTRVPSRVGQGIVSRPGNVGARPAHVAATAKSGPGQKKRKREPPKDFPIPPDTRPPGCGEQVFDPEGRDFRDLRASIIIPYKNEKWEHIKSTVDSIIYYTPKKYVSEILFVSDGNTEETMYANELRNLSNAISLLVIPPPGQGLIEAKMRAVGAVSLQTNVLIFLEPHTRVNRQWIEPLLVRIRKYPRILAMPQLDHIPVNDFNSYYQGHRGHWRFEWNLNLVYTNPSGNGVETAEPMLQPGTSGGIFAIRKDWWNELGLYDSGMVGWGGDHVEASFKVWRCGGHIETVTCSRVGHLFREPQHRPYEVQIDQVVRNYARLAEVWLQGHLHRFRVVKPETEGMNIGNVTQAHALYKKLQCKSMTWYIENVDRELNWEKDYICVPGCSRQQFGNACCANPGFPGRSTLDRIMPLEEYVPLTLPYVGSSSHLSGGGEL